MSHYDMLLHPLYWTSHPSLYISIYVNHDFLDMVPIDFIAKYIHKMEDEEPHSGRRVDIETIVLPLYREMFGVDYELKIKM